MSLATLKTKVQALIYDLKQHKAFYNQLSNYTFNKNLNYYLIPDVITNWNNILTKINSINVTIESNAHITTMNGAFSSKSKGSLTLYINTNNVTDFENAFSGTARRSPINILGTPLDFSSATVLDAFTGCYNLVELRVKENTIPYGVWDMSFTESDNLSEETLLSIARGVIKAPDSVPDDEAAFIRFSSNVLDNMPEYIVDIFNKKRCQLG